MRKLYRSILSVLFAAFILVGGRAVLKAQQASSSAVKAGRWSDPATWADKKVPAEGAAVTIGQGMDVVLDVNTPPLHGLTINGKLSFADNNDLELTTEWIMLHGELEIGTEKAPHTRKATITFTNNVKDEDISGVGGTTKGRPRHHAHGRNPEPARRPQPTPGPSCPTRPTQAPPRSRC